MVLFVFIFTSLSHLLAQDISVSGAVYDNEGETLPGVSVVVKGTTQGTVTDIDGIFRITVPKGSTCCFLRGIQNSGDQHHGTEAAAR